MAKVWSVNDNKFNALIIKQFFNSIIALDAGKIQCSLFLVTLGNGMKFKALVCLDKWGMKYFS